MYSRLKFILLFFQKNDYFFYYHRPCFMPSSSSSQRYASKMDISLLYSPRTLPSFLTPFATPQKRQSRYAKVAQAPSSRTPASPDPPPTCTPNYPSPEGGEDGVARDEVDGVGESKPERSELQDGVHLTEAERLRTMVGDK